MLIKDTEREKIEKIDRKSDDGLVTLFWLRCNSCWLVVYILPNLIYEIPSLDVTFALSR